MNKTPTVILSDALTAFNRAANLAFTTAQDHARKDVTQATTDARDARRERDDAVNALHTSRLEEQAWKQEAAVWKATANQAELTINHHLETIAQLREEATQWKNQCLRLEETSRQEAISWKEQFLRVEQERLKLAQRIEELVAEQLSSSGHAQTSVPPYTPMARCSATGDLSASTRLHHTSAFTPSLKEHSSSKSAPKTVSRANRTRAVPVSQLPTPSSENQRSARRAAQAQESHPPTTQLGSVSNSARQILVRHVRAVVEVPVKEESVDREAPGLSRDVGSSTSASQIASTSISASTSKTPNTHPKTTDIDTGTPRAKRKATKRAYVEVDDGDSAGDNISQSDADDYRPVSDGEDELLMGVEKNRKEVYGMKRVSKQMSVQRSANLTGVKKRKALPKQSRPPIPKS